MVHVFAYFIVSFIKRIPNLNLINIDLTYVDLFDIGRHELHSQGINFESSCKYDLALDSIPNIDDFWTHKFDT